MTFIERGGPLVYGAVGLHPHHATDWDSSLEDRLRTHLRHPRVIALGETGLDFYRYRSPPDVQRCVFARQCELAVALGKPIVVHTRNASADTAAILDRCVPKNHKIHIHCFTDNPSFCHAILAVRPNAYFGVTGAATFASALNVHSVCRIVPLNRILAESDGPFMAPAPFIGQVATPGHIPLVVRAIAKLRGIDEATAFGTIRQNCREFYGF
jgi:TatD DNase family protein